MLERLSDRSRRVLVHAQNEARHGRDRRIGTEHLLLGLLHDAGSPAACALESLGLSMGAVRARLAASPDVAVKSRHAFTLAATRALERANEASSVEHEATVTTRHLLLGLLDVADTASSRVLASFGASAGRVRDVLDALPHQEPPLPRDLARTVAFALQPEDVTGPWAFGPLPAHVPPPPVLPAAVVTELERRFWDLPVLRIHRDADFWALKAVEAEHIERLAHGYQLDDSTRTLAREWWLGDVRRGCEAATAWNVRRERLRLHQAMSRRQPFRASAAFQLY